MSIFLQLWGGTGYLLNKILLAHAEGVSDDRKWRIVGWVMYLIGWPAWVIIFIGKHDWIAAATEISGGPAMVLGLVLALKHFKKTPLLFDWSVKIFTCLMIVSGIGYSICHFGGVTTFSQVLEICITTGFLLGSYLLAKKNLMGWFWLAVMNGSTGTLMAIQDKPILVVQQAISLFFVIRGFVRSRRQMTGH